jgi:hypothetical protein
MMFSMGMPILYIIGCAIFLSQYFIHKTLLFKYHSKTTKFGQNLALGSVDYMKWGLLFHVVFGFVNFIGTYETLLPSHILHIICALPIFVMYIFTSLKDKLLFKLKIKSDSSDDKKVKPADLYFEMKISQLYMFYYRTVTERNEIFENVGQIDPTCYNN